MYNDCMYIHDDFCFTTYWVNFITMICEVWLIANWRIFVFFFWQPSKKRPDETSLLAANRSTNFVRKRHDELSWLDFWSWVLERSIEREKKSSADIKILLDFAIFSILSYQCDIIRYNHIISHISLYLFSKFSL